MDRKNFLKRISPLLILPLIILKPQSKEQYGIGFEILFGENMKKAIIEQIPYYDEIPKGKDINNVEILWETLNIQDYYDEVNKICYQDSEFLYNDKGDFVKEVVTTIHNFKDHKKYNPSEHILYCEVQILI